jgi:hypothetical protein
MNRKKRAAYAQAIWVHFNDEARRIGSGVRPVVVESITKKWVTLRPGSFVGFQRIKPAIWATIPQVRKPGS